MPLQNKNIVFVLPSLKLGGAERQALLLARYLIQHQTANVLILGFGTPGMVTKICSTHGIPCHSLAYGWPANRLRRIQVSVRFGLTLRQYKPDILLAYSSATKVCGLSWRLTGAELYVWNQRNDGLDFQGTRLDRLAVQLTRRFVSNSEHAANFLVQRLNVDRDKIAVVYNGIKPVLPNEEHLSWRTRLQIEEHNFVACMVANLRYPKDHATLLKAWRRVVDELSEESVSAILLLAGRFDGTHDALKVLAFDLGLCDSVYFLGMVEDVPGLLDAADLGIFSSLHEGCPNGILECMAAGLAVVGTDIPGIREAVGETNYTWLAPPGDDEKLASDILILAKDTNLRKQLGLLNQQRIVERFSFEQMGQTMAMLLSKWLAK